MKAVLIILFLSLANDSFCQRYSNNYTSALNALKRTDTVLAKNCLLKCIDISKKCDTINYEEIQSCNYLQEIFFVEKKFDSCLLYLDYPGGKRKVFRQMCQGGFGEINKLRTVFRESLCYYHLQLKDKAIKKLMPYIFITESPFPEDSVEINAISEFFVSAIYELHGKCESRILFQEAVSEIKFSPLIRDDSIVKLKAVDMNYTFRFLDCTVNLRGTSTDYFKDEELKQIDAYRAWMWKDFLASKAYRLLVE